MNLIKVESYIIPFSQMLKYTINSSFVDTEFSFSSEEKASKIYPILKSKINNNIQVIINNYKFNFILKECYFDFNKIIMKGSQING